VRHDFVLVYSSLGPDIGDDPLDERVRLEAVSESLARLVIRLILEGSCDVHTALRQSPTSILGGLQEPERCKGSVVTRDECRIESYGTSDITQTCWLPVVSAFVEIADQNQP
jgi:hypothetical protein